MPEVHVMGCEEIAGKTETAILPFLRGIRYPPGAEEAVGRMCSKAVLPVARACATVLHAGLPVLISILNTNRARFH